MKTHLQAEREGEENGEKVGHLASRNFVLCLAVVAELFPNSFFCFASFSLGFVLFFNTEHTLNNKIAVQWAAAAETASAFKCTQAATRATETVAATAAKVDFAGNSY